MEQLMKEDGLKWGGEVVDQVQKVHKSSSLPLLSANRSLANGIEPSTNGGRGADQLSECGVNDRQASFGVSSLT